MPKISDMTDEQIAGFFYLALWNNEITKILGLYPNAVPVARQTGPIGFYLWTQKFGYENATASTDTIRESVKFISNYPTGSKAVDQKIYLLEQKLPLLKHSSDQKFNDILIVWFGFLARSARTASIAQIRSFLEQLNCRMGTYVTKCNANADINVADVFMTALINVMLFHLGTERLNFLKATMSLRTLDDSHKISILKAQSSEHRQDVLNYIKDSPIIKEFCNLVLEEFHDELQSLKQEDDPKLGSGGRSSSRKNFNPV